MTPIAKLMISIVLLIWATLLSLPFLMYGYGLYQLGELPKPRAAKQLSVKQQSIIWKHFKGKGPVHVRPFGPYEYLTILSCIANVPSDREKPAVISGCYSEFPGFEHVMSLVEQLRGAPIKKNSQSKPLDGQQWLNSKHFEQIIIFSSQAIWISQNWTTDQILAALKVKK